MKFDIDSVPAPARYDPIHRSKGIVGRLRANNARLFTALAIAKAALAHKVPDECWMSEPSGAKLLTCPGCDALKKIESLLKGSSE